VSPRQGARFDAGEVRVLAGHVREPVQGIPRDGRSLQSGVSGRLVAVGAKEVADRRMAQLMVASCLADMQVM